MEQFEKISRHRLFYSRHILPLSKGELEGVSSEEWAKNKIDPYMGLLYNTSRQTLRRKELRNNMPEAERKLWAQLKGKSLDGFKFRRQYGVGPYVLDFYCPEVKLGIELDGDSHYTKDAMEYDSIRQAQIESMGIKIIRFTNIEIDENLTSVLEGIQKFLTRPPLTPPC